MSKDILTPSNNTVILVPANRTATSPGEILIKEFIEPLGLIEVANRLGMTLRGVLALETQRITPAIANTLARGLGTTPEFWTNLQAAYDSSTSHNSTESP